MSKKQQVTSPNLSRRLQNVPWLETDEEPTEIRCKTCHSHPYLARKTGTFYPGSKNFNHPLFDKHQKSKEHNLLLTNHLFDGWRKSQKPSRFISRLWPTMKSPWTSLGWLNSAVHNRWACEALPWRGLGWLDGKVGRWYLRCHFTKTMATGCGRGFPCWWQGSLLWHI